MTFLDGHVEPGVLSGKEPWRSIGMFIQLRARILVSCSLDARSAEHDGRILPRRLERHLTLRTAEILFREDGK